jgi:hypothetical protein
MFFYTYTITYDNSYRPLNFKIEKQPVTGQKRFFLKIEERRKRKMVILYDKVLDSKFLSYLIALFLSHHHHG